MATRDYQFVVGPETSTLPTATDPVADADIVSKGYADDIYARRFSWYDSRPTVQNVRDISVADRADGQVVWCDALTKFFFFDSASAAADDGTTVLAPSVGTGRWLQVPAAGVDVPISHFAEGAIGDNGSASLNVDISPPHYVASARTISVVRLTAKNSGSGTTTVQLYKNGSSAGSTASLTGTGAQAGSTTTLGTTISTSAGDRITARFTALASASEDIRIDHN